VKTTGPGKPIQAWFYDRRDTSISVPPEIPLGAVVSYKLLYICESVNSDGQCLKCQIRINERDACCRQQSGTYAASHLCCALCLLCAQTALGDAEELGYV
jgi:hypothetical protein